MRGRRGVPLLGNSPPEIDDLAWAMGNVPVVAGNSTGADLDWGEPQRMSESMAHRGHRRESGGSCDVSDGHLRHLDEEHSRFLEAPSGDHLPNRLIRRGEVTRKLTATQLQFAGHRFDTELRVTKLSLDQLCRAPTNLRGDVVEAVRTIGLLIRNRFHQLNTRRLDRCIDARRTHRSPGRSGQPDNKGTDRAHEGCVSGRRPQSMKHSLCVGAECGERNAHPGVLTRLPHR